MSAPDIKLLIAEVTISKTSNKHTACCKTELLANQLVKEPGHPIHEFSFQKALSNADNWPPEPPTFPFRHPNFCSYILNLPVKNISIEV